LFADSGKAIAKQLGLFLHRFSNIAHVVGLSLTKAN
jgi:hypothetical protein